MKQQLIKIWSAIIRINTQDKTLIMKFGPGLLLFIVSILFQLDVMNIKISTLAYT